VIHPVQVVQRVRCQHDCLLPEHAVNHIVSDVRIPCDEQTTEASEYHSPGPRKDSVRLFPAPEHAIDHIAHDRSADMRIDSAQHVVQDVTAPFQRILGPVMIESYI